MDNKSIFDVREDGQSIVNLAKQKRIDEICESMNERRLDVYIPELGKQIEIHSGVFPSDKGEGSHLLLQYLKKINIRGLDVLEMGTGCGVVAIMAAKQKANKVIAADVSSLALENAKANAKICDVQGKVNFIESNLFEDLGNQKFDLIIFNPPFIGGSWEIKSAIQESGHLVALFDPYGRTLKTFLSQAHKYLKPEKGRILLAHSDHVRPSYLRKLIDEQGYERKFVRSGFQSFEVAEIRVPFVFFVLELKDLLDRKVPSKKVRLTENELRVALKTVTDKKQLNVYELLKKYGKKRFFHGLGPFINWRMLIILLPIIFGILIGFRFEADIIVSISIGITVASLILALISTFSLDLGVNRFSYDSFGDFLSALGERIDSSKQCLKLCFLLPLPGIFIDKNLGPIIQRKVKEISDYQFISAFTDDERLMQYYVKFGGEEANRAVNDSIAFRKKLWHQAEGNINYCPIRVTDPPCLLAIIDGELAMVAYFDNDASNIKNWFRLGFETSTREQVSSLEGLFNYLAYQGTFDPGFIEDVQDSGYGHFENKILQSIIGDPLEPEIFEILP